MKTFIVLVLATVSLATKSPVLDEQTCESACDALYTQPYKECHGIPECELYVSNQAKRCILKCEGQSGE